MTSLANLYCHFFSFYNSHEVFIFWELFHLNSFGVFDCIGAIDSGSNFHPVCMLALWRIYESDKLLNLPNRHHFQHILRMYNKKFEQILSKGCRLRVAIVIVKFSKIFKSNHNSMFALSLKSFYLKFLWEDHEIHQSVLINFIQWER